MDLGLVAEPQGRARGQHRSVSLEDEHRLERDKGQADLGEFHPSLNGAHPRDLDPPIGLLPGPLAPPLSGRVPGLENQQPTGAEGGSGGP